MREVMRDDRGLAAPAQNFVVGPAEKSEAGGLAFVILGYYAGERRGY